MNAQMTSQRILPIYNYGADYPFVKHQNKRVCLKVFIKFSLNSITRPNLTIMLGERTILSVYCHPSKEAMPFLTLFNILDILGYKFPVFDSSDVICTSKFKSPFLNPSSYDVINPTSEHFIPLTYLGDEVITYSNLRNMMDEILIDPWLSLHITERRCYVMPLSEVNLFLSSV